MDSPRYVARLHLQVTIPFVKNWEKSHRLVKIRADDILFSCIEKPLQVERHGLWRTFPQWTVHYAEPGALPGSGWWRDE